MIGPAPSWAADAYFETSGAARDRGAAIGARFRKRIYGTVDFYRGVIPLQDVAWIRQGARFRAVIRNFRPDLATEIEACAEAAGVCVEHLFCVNARSELMASAASVGECTALWLPQPALLGQTWDWAEAFEPLFVVLAHNFDDGRRLVTVTEPGILAKIGINKAGIGVCLNFLFAGRAWTDGVPVHVFLRAILECRTWSEVEDVAGEHSNGLIGNVLIGSADSKAIDIEGQGAIPVISRPDGPFAHTNHLLGDKACGAPVEVLEDSKARLAAAQRTASKPSAGYDDLVDALSDTRSGPTLRSYKPSSMGFNVGTVCTTIADLRARSLSVRAGPSTNGPFAIYNAARS